MRYSYSVIQYRGDPVRGESINVGVAVVGADGGVAIRVDRRAYRRIISSYPSFNRRMFAAFVRDLRHVLADTHQLMLGEPVHLSARAEWLSALAVFAANQFGLTEPRRFNASSPGDAVDGLYRRMVDDTPRDPQKSRHMTRGALRIMITDILGAWARTQTADVVLEPQMQIQGHFAMHTADLVALDGDSPRMVFFATPLVGPSATLIRDSLPTVIRDIQRTNYNAKFYAILGPTEETSKSTENSAAVARQILREVQGLTVLEVDELKAYLFEQPVLAR